MVISGSPRLCRYCSRCGKKFRPTGKFEMMCIDCRKKNGKTLYG